MLNIVKGESVGLRPCCRYIFSAQVAFRVVTFAMNAWVLRHISREVLGLVNVRLNLLDDTIMFLSKEGFRLACLGHKGREGWQQVRVSK